MRVVTRLIRRKEKCLTMERKYITTFGHIEMSTLSSNKSYLIFHFFGPIEMSYLNFHFFGHI